MCISHFSRLILRDFVLRMLFAIFALAIRTSSLWDVHLSQTLFSLRTQMRTEEKFLSNGYHIKKSLRQECYVSPWWTFSCPAIELPSCNFDLSNKICMRT